MLLRYYLRQHCLLCRPVPDYNYKNTPYITYALGALHNLFTACVLISYFITNHPTLPRFKALR